MILMSCMGYILVILASGFWKRLGYVYVLDEAFWFYQVLVDGACIIGYSPPCSSFFRSVLLRSLDTTPR